MGVFQYWPNRITALRFLGALVLFAVLEIDLDPERLRGGLSAIAAFWLFLAVALSDILDGWLARRGNVVSAFGRIADPFVDKVLVLGSMVYLSVAPWSRGLFPAWVVVVILSREFLVTGIRGYMESIGAEFPADRFGKIKMLCQCLAIGFALGARAFSWTDAQHSFLLVATQFLVWVTVAATVGSGFTYVAKMRGALAGERA